MSWRSGSSSSSAPLAAMEPFCSLLFASAFRSRIFGAWAIATTSIIAVITLPPKAAPVFAPYGRVGLPGLLSSRRGVIGVDTDPVAPPQQAFGEGGEILVDLERTRPLEPVQGQFIFIALLECGLWREALATCVLSPMNSICRL